MTAPAPPSSVPPAASPVDPVIAAELVHLIDWERADLRDTPAAALHRAGDASAAAVEFVRHLRARAAPFAGYSREYVARLRAAADDDCRATLRRELDTLLGVRFQGGQGAADGRGTLLGATAHALQIAGTTDHFTRYAGNVAASRDAWEKSSMHSILYLTNYLQAVWPLGECPDAAIVPILTFLAVKLPLEWRSARTWCEVSFGNSGHNWFIVQYGATWKAGLLFPELRGFEKFRALFPAYFEREMNLLIDEDGYTRERSVHYHAGTIDYFLHITRLAHANGLKLSDAYHRRLRAAYELEWKLMTPAGGHPPFGDIYAQGPYYLARARSVASILHIPLAKHLAELLDPDDAAASDMGGPRLRDMMIESLHYPSVGDDLLPDYVRLAPQAPDAPDTALRKAGLYVMRSGWDRRADYLAIEASERGNVVTSHAHGVIFDLFLVARGRPILIGNGKGPCGSPEPPRTWRVGSSSHNAATVDGVDHVPLRSVYRFERTVTPTIDAWITAPTHAYFSGAHEAYEHLPHKVSGSRRKLFYLRGNYWLLIDRFTAASPEHEHVYRQHFQLGVPATLTPDGCATTRGPGGNLMFVPVPGATGSATLTPNPHPLPDHPNPDQLVYTQRVKGRETLFVTLMIPFENHDTPRVGVRLLPVRSDDRTLSAWEATGLEIIVNGRRDVHLDWHLHWCLPWTVADFAGDTRLFNSAVR